MSSTKPKAIQLNEAEANDLLILFGSLEEEFGHLDEKYVPIKNKILNVVAEPNTSSKKCNIGSSLACAECANSSDIPPCIADEIDQKKKEFLA